MSKGVSKVSERANKGASKQTSERSGVYVQREQGRMSEQVSGTSEQANGRASGPILQSGFFVILAHSALTNKSSSSGASVVNDTRAPQKHPL